MRKSHQWLTGLIVLAAALGGCSRKPKDLKGQVSYGIGHSFGRSLKAQNLDLDKKALANGVADGYTGEKPAMTEDEMQNALVKFNEKRVEAQNAQAEQNKVKSDEFLAKNKDEEDVRVTKSGLQYKIIEQGEGASPKFEETVVVNYRGTLIDGTEFDSTYKRGQPAEFPVKGVIPGWTEGLQMMKKGGKAIFYVPPELGYGGSARQQIPANAVLIFDVELLDIKPSPKPSAPAAAPKPAAKPKTR